MQLSPENFERLLNWLHPNREEAGQEYQRIRALLIKKFQSHSCHFPDKLADVTMDRVAKKLTPARVENWVGDKEPYFYRVAYYILLEDRDNLPEMQIPEDFEVTKPDDKEDLEPKLRCLEKCLSELPNAKRELIVKYYQGKRSVKIKNREELARDLNVNLPGLRVRALRIRKELRACIEKCLKTGNPSRTSAGSRTRK